MRKFFVVFTLLLSALVAGGCGSGGGGGDLPIDVPDDGGQIIPIDPGVDPTPTTTVYSIEVTISSASIRTNETAEVNVLLLNSTGQLVGATKEVAFSLDAPTFGSITPTLRVTGGVADPPATFTAKDKEGSVKITATVDGKSDSKTIQISNLAAAATITLTPNPATINPGGTSVISATVEDSAGNPMPNGTVVNFSVSDSAIGSILASETTTNGVAQATFSAGTNSGIATITATSGIASETADITVNQNKAGSIEFISATPQIIAIKTAGGVETSEVKFLVKDDAGKPIVGSKQVRLALSGPNGGEYLDAPSKTTIDVGTVDGIASTFLHSGTIPGTATIMATVLDELKNPTTLTTSSGVIAIGGGIPSAGHFSLSTESLNVASGLDIDGIEKKINVHLADRYGNYNVLKGTTVSFYSECGGIDRAVALDEFGRGQVIFRTQDPRPLPQTPDPLGTLAGFGSCGPICDLENAFISAYNLYLDYDITADPFGYNPRDGLCTVIAVADGEEEFTDSDGSGKYDGNDKFVDTYDDIHIEMDDDPTNVPTPGAGYPHDPEFEDLVVDRNKNGTFDGLNQIWDGNKRIAKRINLLITGSEYYLATSTNTINIANGGSQTIYFALHDVFYNRPKADSKITISATGANLQGQKSYTYLDSNGLGTPILSATLLDADPTQVKATQVELKFTWEGQEASIFGISQ